MGICRGCQLVNIAHRGSLFQDLTTERSNIENHAYNEVSPKHVATHKAKIKHDSQLWSIFERDEIEINSFHHQAIKVLGQDLKVIATAPDGTIEAIEKEGDRFIVAVQWHPEMMHEHDVISIKLFNRFIEVCKN